MHTRGEFAMRYLVWITIICALAALAGPATAAEQKTFASPAAAIKAVQEALAANDVAAIRAIFGPDMDALRCSDPADDVRAMQTFAKAMGQMCNPVFRTGDCANLYVGAENYPFPIPLVYKNGCWRFDTASGVQEILARRIGANELSAIEVCRNYHADQLEYAQADCAGGGSCAYAQKFSCDPGKRNGLDWQAKCAETSTGMSTENCPAPAACAANGADTFTCQGYIFKILKAQGPAARGGQRSYLSNGKMVGGFALAAYPLCWGKSGLTSFMIGPDGRVYQRNLGTATPEWGATVSAFNPEPGWCLVDD